MEVFTEVVEENFRCTEASQLPPHLTSPIHSASIWYHFAFVAISVALLGWGLGGFTVHLLKQRVRLSMEMAALVTLLYAGAIPPAAFSSLRFAHRSLLQEFRNPQSAIRNLRFLYLPSGSQPFALNDSAIRMRN